MLSYIDVKKECDSAGIGPVIEITRLTEVTGIKKSSIYQAIARKEILKGMGRGVVTRSSFEKFLFQHQEFFCRLFDRNRKAKTQTENIPDINNTINNEQEGERA